MNVYKAEWSGSYPCYCSGEWTLYINNKPCEIEIPFQNSPANTEGNYQEWWFDENWCEQFGSYSDGMCCEEWCKEYQDYLSKIAPREDWEEIFEAFQDCDWRHGECGGCI